MGSAGSGKSWFITQKLVLRALTEPIRILVCRRYASTLRNTCFIPFCDMIRQWKLKDYVKINQSDYRITFPHNGSEIIFMGLDDETKLLSLYNIGSIFIEEAYEVSQDIVEQLNLRMRGKNLNQQIIMAWNPISSNSWIYNFTVANPPENSIFLHSTYKDNKFLSTAYIQALEELYTRNPQKARIYCDGQWGIDTDGLVFSNWREVDTLDLSTLVNQGFKLRVGMDLGWTDPTTLVSSMYDERNKKIYVFDCLYQPHMQLDEVDAAMRERKWLNRHTKIQMDAAEPRTIDYFVKKDWYAVPCVKGPGSVQSRISFLQNNEIIVARDRCSDLITELSNFSYIKDKKTNTFSDKTTHEFSHAIDGLGYAYSDLYTGGGVAFLDKALLGL